jgi:hypothetical protein
VNVSTTPNCRILKVAKSLFGTTNTERYILKSGLGTGFKEQKSIHSKALVENDTLLLQVIRTIRVEVTLRYFGVRFTAT